LRADQLLLSDIETSISRILEYCLVEQEQFLSDSMRQDAVIRNFEVIGEAIKGLSPEIKQIEPGVNWRAAAGMRDKLIHDYHGVDFKLVWQTVLEVLPELRAAVRRMKEFD
jgi:uncharacterized protein with HEPN domain